MRLGSIRSLAKANMRIQLAAFKRAAFRVFRYNASAASRILFPEMMSWAASRSYNQHLAFYYRCKLLLVHPDLSTDSKGLLRAASLLQALDEWIQAHVFSSTVRRIHLANEHCHEDTPSVHAVCCADDKGRKVLNTLSDWLNSRAGLAVLRRDSRMWISPSGETIDRLKTNLTAASFTCFILEARIQSAARLIERNSGQLCSDNNASTPTAGEMASSRFFILGAHQLYVLPAYCVPDSCLSVHPQVRASGLRHSMGITWLQLFSGLPTARIRRWLQGLEQAGIWCLASDSPVGVRSPPGDVHRASLRGEVIRSSAIQSSVRPP